MSIQEDNLARIAAAIRAKGGPSGKIKASAFADAILNLPTGGGSTSDNKLYISSIPLAEYDTMLDIHSDTELSDAVSITDFEVTDNVSSIDRVDNLNVRAHFTHELLVDDVVTFTAKPSAYKNHNGTSERLSFIVPPLAVSDLFNTTKRMTIVRNNVKNDDGVDSITTSNTWPSTNLGYPRGTFNSFQISGNSFITVGNIAEAFKLNRRDAASYYIWKQEGACMRIPFVKFRWKGASTYAGAVDQEWEIVFFSNGDACVNLIKLGSTTGGTFEFFGNTYTISAESPFVSFYRKEYNGTSFTVVNEIYDPSKHDVSTEILQYSSTLTDAVVNYMGRAIVVNNVKNDDNYVTCGVPDIEWNYNGATVKTLYVSGNSYMGLESNIEHIKVNRRDAALYYLYVDSIKLTDVDNIIAARFIWGGSSHHSEPVNQWWSLYLFDNGDAMLHIKQIGASTDGISSFCGVSFTAANDKCISFYRNNVEGTSWIMEEAIYNLGKHKL